MSGIRDTPDASTSADTREKAARLFAYLRELAKLRLSMVRDCRDYEEIVWFHEIPMEPECASIARSLAPDESEPWLKIERVDEPECPEPPQVCSEWIDAATLGDSSGSATGLRDEIVRPSVNPDEPPVVHSLRDHPDVQRGWESFLREKWDTWAAEHRRWQTIQHVYDRLFLMHQDAQEKRRNIRGDSRHRAAELADGRWAKDLSPHPRRASESSI